MKRYAEYKDSGVEWIGEIPKWWELRRVKQIFERKKGEAKQDAPVVLLLSRESIKIRDISTNEGQLAESYYNYNPVEIGDFLLNPMDLYSGANCNVSFVEGVISPAYINLRTKKDDVPRYFDYYFKTQYWKMALFAHGKGVSFDNRWTLSNETLMNYRTPCPPADEQRVIASYLDYKAAAIDTIIVGKQQLIALLKERRQAIISDAVTKGIDKNAKTKDSGIEWIGETPEGWEVGKVGYFYQVQLGKTLQPEQKTIDETLEQYLCAINIGKDGLKFDIIKEMWFTPHEKEVYALNKGDLLVVEGGDVGLSAIYSNEPQNCFIQNALHRVRGSNHASNEYLMYWLSFLKHIGYFELVCNKATIAHFTKDKFINTVICLPPIEVQKQIINHLIEQTQKIDLLTSDIHLQVEKLKEYRQSVISEAVTGKVEI